jgi:insulysin
MEVYDAKAIQDCMDALDESKWRLTIVSQADLGLEGPKSTERWYGTEYSSDDISYLKEKIIGLEIDPAFHLPAKNMFVPENFEVNKPEGTIIPRETPKLLINNEFVTLWHKKDDQFFVPRANVYIHFRTPVVYVDPFASVAARMFSELLRDHLVEYAYYAEIAGLHYSVDTQVDGVNVIVSGYSDKIVLLLEKVLEKIKAVEFVSEQRFPLILELLKRSYANWKMDSPHSHAIYNTTRILQDKLWTHEDKIPVVEDPDFNVEAIRRFVPTIFEKCFVEMLVHGNMDEGQAIKVWETVEEVMKMKPLAESERKKSSRSMLLNEGESWIWEREVPNPVNPNSALEYYLECGDPSSVALRCRVQLLTQIAYEPSFDTLRTKEQLGYLVWSGHRRQAGTIGFRVVVQSEKDPKYVESRVENFLTQFRVSWRGQDPPFLTCG